MIMSIKVLLASASALISFSSEHVGVEELQGVVGEVTVEGWMGVAGGELHQPLAGIWNN